MSLIKLFFSHFEPFMLLSSLLFIFRRLSVEIVRLFCKMGAGKDVWVWFEAICNQFYNLNNEWNTGKVRDHPRVCTEPTGTSTSIPVPSRSQHLRNRVHLLQNSKLWKWSDFMRNCQEPWRYWQAPHRKYEKNKVLLWAVLLLSEYHRHHSPIQSWREARQRFQNDRKALFQRQTH